MKKIFKRLNLFILSLCLFAFSFADCTFAEGTLDGETSGDIVVLYTNDVHCAVDENLGYTSLAAYQALMKEETDYVTMIKNRVCIQKRNYDISGLPAGPN